jgi:hypothetical protein
VEPRSFARSSFRARHACETLTRGAGQRLPARADSTRSGSVRSRSVMCRQRSLSNEASRKTRHVRGQVSLRVEFTACGPAKSTRGAGAACSMSGVPLIERKTLHAARGTRDDVGFSAIFPLSLAEPRATQESGAPRVVAFARSRACSAPDGSFTSIDRLGGSVPAGGLSARAARPRDRGDLALRERGPDLPEGRAVPGRCRATRLGGAPAFPQRHRVPIRGRDPPPARARQAGRPRDRGRRAAERPHHRALLGLRYRPLVPARHRRPSGGQTRGDRRFDARPGRGRKRRRRECHAHPAAAPGTGRGVPLADIHGRAGATAAATISSRIMRPRSRPRSRAKSTSWCTGATSSIGHACR